MPCWELFEEQSDEYKESILPKSCKAIVSVEAGSTFGWAKYAHKSIGRDDFGACLAGISTRSSASPSMRASRLPSLSYPCAYARRRIADTLWSARAAVFISVAPAWLD